MRYEIRHVSLRSTAKYGLMAGFALAFLPALCVAGLAVQLVRQVARAFESLTGVLVDLPDIDIGLGTIPLPDIPINLVQQLGLSNTAETVDRLGASLGVVFFLTMLGVIVGGVLLLLLPALLFVLIYNVLAPAVGGVAVDLRSKE